MKGDYHRYLAEFKTSTERKEAVESTLFAYKTAQDIAISELAPTHHIILELALNFSVFYYEILNSQDRACVLAFDEEITESKHEYVSTMSFQKDLELKAYGYFSSRLQRLVKLATQRKWMIG